MPHLRSTGSLRDRDRLLTLLKLALALALAFSFGSGASSQEQPPLEVLSAIDERLAKLDASAEGKDAQFAPGAPATPACGMQHFTMTLSNQNKSNSFSVLLDPQPKGSGVHPKQLLVQTRILHVDADGSPRAYHPEDPAGKGVCTLTRTATGAFVPQSGICALDPLSNAGVRLFKGTERLTKEAFAAAWTSVWAQIKERRLRPLDAQSLAGLEFSKRYFGFYWGARSMTVLFKKDIVIPARDGFPCVRNERSNYPGYFVAATTLSSAADSLAGEPSPSSEVAPAGCLANRSIDAERIPFVVIPGKGAGDIGVGDIAVVYLNQGGRDKVIYAIIADSGPSASFGEGSIALNQILLGEDGQPVMNNAQANRLDIGPSRNLAVNMLLFGGTRQLLQGDYSVKNIERVGQQQLAAWQNSENSGASRLRSCAREAVPNPSHRR